MDIYEKLDFYRKRAGLTNQQMAHKDEEILDLFK